MSSFLFLTFCVYVFRCLGLHFSEFILLGLSSGGFYLCRTNLHRGLTPGQQGLSEAWVVLLSLPRPLTGHKSSHRGEFGFSPQNELTPPPKGGGAGYHLGWVCWGFHAEKPGTFPQEKTDTSYPRASLSSCHRQLLVTNGSHGDIVKIS